MDNSKTQQNRKNFAIGLSVIGILIAVASASSTYAINLESFKDWSSNFATTLALLATVGIEAMFVLSVYGMSYALTGASEKFVGVVALTFLIFVMASNFVIHRQVVNSIELSQWQQAYYQWAGALSLFGVLIIIVIFGAVSYEARERRLQRDIEFEAKKKALEWKKSALQSSALGDYLDQYQGQVFEDVRRQLQLPATRPGATAQKQIGFPRSEDEKNPK